MLTNRGGTLQRLAMMGMAVVLLLAASQLVFAGFDVRVEQAQSRLTELGFDPGPVDGLMGTRTHEALTVFQRDHGLPANGRLTQETRQALDDALNRRVAPVQTPQAPTSTPLEPATTTEVKVVVLPEPTRSNSGTTKFLSYTELGWNPPQSGANAKAQFLRDSGSPEMVRGQGEVVVPRGKAVYVLARGERIPGFDCDPASGSLTIELMLGIDGPMLVRSGDADGFCQLGFGAVFSVGRTLRISEIQWGEDNLPAGRVKLTDQGLRYLGQ